MGVLTALWVMLVVFFLIALLFSLCRYRNSMVNRGVRTQHRTVVVTASPVYTVQDPAWNANQPGGGQGYQYEAPPPYTYYYSNGTQVVTPVPMTSQQQTGIHNPNAQPYPQKMPYPMTEVPLHN